MTKSLEELTRIVTELQDRAEIWQCLLRYCRGVDRFDRELLLSAFHPDAVDDHGKIVGGPQEFATWAFAQHCQAHLGHTHNLFNHYCEIDGDVAHAETYFMFAGINREGTPLVMNGGRYLDRLEKREGEWKIAYRTLVRDWGFSEDRPDPERPSSYTSTRAYLDEDVKRFLDLSPVGQRNRNDPLYQRPFALSTDRLRSWQELLAHRNGKSGATS
jgi:hypothetical protein